MNIAIASDHAGFAFKVQLESWLRGRGHVVQDFGCPNEESCDYPDFGIPAVQSVVGGHNGRAILICGNGIGMSMLANKIPGIFAAVVYSASTAKDTREHHDSNVLCLGAREGEDRFPELIKWTQVWLTTGFKAGRHERRIDKVKALDER